jgi:hypothetical protein
VACRHFAEKIKNPNKPNSCREPTKNILIPVAYSFWQCSDFRCFYLIIKRVPALVNAQTIGEAFGDRTTTLNCRYELARKYDTRAYKFGLSAEGIYKLTCQTPLSRYLGLVEIWSAAGPSDRKLPAATATLVSRRRWVRSVIIDL